MDVKEGGKMFCPNCGNKIEDGARFCGHCGAQLEKNTSADAASPAGRYAGSTNAVRPAASKKPIIAAAVVAAVMIAAAGGFAYSKLSNTVNVNKYVTVTFEGSDGAGRAYVEVDAKKLYKDWGKKLQIKDKDVREACEYLIDNYLEAPEDIKSKAKKQLGASLLRDAIASSYYFDHSSGLSNGDEVDLSWRDEAYVNWDLWMLDSVVDSVVENKSLEDVLDIKLKMDDKSFKVKGLE